MISLKIFSFIFVGIQSALSAHIRPSSPSQPIPVEEDSVFQYYKVDIPPGLLLDKVTSADICLAAGMSGVCPATGRGSHGNIRSCRLLPLTDRSSGSSVAERICEHSPLCSKLAGILTHIKLGKFGFLDLAYSDGAFVISTDVSSHDRTMYAFCALVK